jgi:putative ABC transport system permease protein
MLRGKRALTDLDKDIRDHLDRETEDHIARGLSPEEARRQAMLAFGSVTLAKEDTRAVWVWAWLEQLRQDVRYQLRILRRNPAFAAVIVLTLAAAIGMTTAIVSVANAVVVRPLSYPHAERLVWVSTGSAEEAFVIGPDFVDWRARAASFDRMAAYGTGDHTLVSARGATRVRAARVTEDFWSLSGAAPASGQLPRSEDAIVLSASFARRWFADDADIVGRTVTLDGRQVAIAGVLPPAFRFHLPDATMSGLPPSEIDIYSPMEVSPARGGPVALLSVVARLKAGTTIDGARVEVEAIRASLAEAHPTPFDDQRALRIVPLQEQLIGGAGRMMRILLGAVGCVLLIACANAASLLLARAAARTREMAVRISIGAGRTRVLRQLLVESLVLVTLGSAAGLLLARLTVAAIVRFSPHAIPRLAETTIDGRVLAIMLITSVLTALLFGLAPALALWRVDPHAVLKAGAPSTTTMGVTGVRIHRCLVAGEVALALMLLIGAGLLLKSAWRLRAYPPGFEPHRVLTARLEFSGPQFFEPPRQIAFVDTLLDRLRHTPGIEAASLSTHGDSLARWLMVEGQPPPSPDDLDGKPPLLINATSAALRRVMGFQVLRGRWFSDDEPAAVLNEQLVRRAFAGRDPIGRRFQLSEGGPMLTIVGVVADVRYSTLDAPPEPEVYVPYRLVQDGLFGFTVLVRTTTDPRALAATVRTAISEIDPTQAPHDVMTLEQALADTIAPRRLTLLLFTTFAAAALILALTGISGVLAYAVTQRIQEIGVRMTLGAQRGDVVAMVIRQGMTVALSGIAAGVGGALALARFMESLLYDVQPTDPWTIIGLTAALATAALLACCTPALRAARVDPITTLRYE